MSSLCTALDVLQNGGITSGIDMFLNVDFARWCKGFWCQSLWTRTSMAIFEIHLLHASHLQVNLDFYGATSFSWMCMMFLTPGLTRFNNKTETNFSAKLRFAFFLEAACRFTTTSLEKKNVLEF